MKTRNIVIGIIWAAPISFIALVLYFFPMWLYGVYKPVGRHEYAWLWRFDTERAPAWLLRLWGRYAGSAIGNLIICKDVGEEHRMNILLKHEMVHVRQCMLLGIFQPLIYVQVLIAGNLLKWAYNAPTDGYSDCIFEVAARREAGQIVDVIGTAMEIKARLTKH